MQKTTKTASPSTSWSSVSTSYATIPPLSVTEIPTHLNSKVKGGWGSILLQSYVFEGEERKREGAKGGKSKDGQIFAKGVGMRK